MHRYANNTSRRMDLDVVCTVRAEETSPNAERDSNCIPLPNKAFGVQPFASSRPNPCDWTTTVPDITQHQ